MKSVYDESKNEITYSNQLKQLWSTELSIQCKVKMIICGFSTTSFIPIILHIAKLVMLSLMGGTVEIVLLRKWLTSWSSRWNCISIPTLFYGSKKETC